MGGPEVHPGSTPDHIRQCDSEADVKAKGRLMYMEQAIQQVNPDDEEAMQWVHYHSNKYDGHKNKSKEIVKARNEALIKMRQVLADNGTKTMEDFKFLIDTLYLMESAHEALANSYILRYYQSDEDKQLKLLFVQEDLEAMLNDLYAFIENWYFHAIDYADIEGDEFVELKPKMGAKFALYKLKLCEQKAIFEKQFNSIMNQIELYFTAESTTHDHSSK